MNLPGGWASSPLPGRCGASSHCPSTGYRRATDISGGLEEGFGWSDLNIVDGRRRQSAAHFLRR
jgi:choline dehydrogenase